eukprot:383289-Rhodomonas_salina.6
MGIRNGHNGQSRGCPKMEKGHPGDFATEWSLRRALATATYHLQREPVESESRVQVTSLPVSEFNRLGNKLPVARVRQGLGGKPTSSPC